MNKYASLIKFILTTLAAACVGAAASVLLSKHDPKALGEAASHWLITASPVLLMATFRALVWIMTTILLRSTVTWASA